MINKTVKKKMIMTFSLILFITGIAIIIILLTSGIFSSSRYLEPWKKSYVEQFRDPRIKVASIGMLAANGHNMQPWKVRLDQQDASTFRLYADADRLTPEVDPYARQTMITQGTFLEYITIAGEQLGYKTTITLFPDGNYDERDLKTSMRMRPVAKVTLTKALPHMNPLFRFIYLPDTNREPYSEIALSNEQMNTLQNIQGESDAALHIFQDEIDVNRLGQYAVTGAAIEAGVHRINEESARLFRANEHEKNQYRYGFSLEGQGTTGFKLHMMQGLISIFPFINNEKAGSELLVNSTRTAIEHTPAFAMIITKDNSRIQQVQAGMLYSRLILTAHSLGLVMQPVSQVLEEYPEMEEQYAGIHREYTTHSGTIQMLVRLGAPTKSAPFTMRRDVSDIVTN
ncbi:hypothetical protein D3C72_741930 [compost metagenome]